MNSLNKTDRVQMLASILRGLEKPLNGGAPVVLGGAPFTEAEIVAVLQADLDGMQRSDDALSAYRVAVAQEKALHTKADAVVRLLKLYVRSRCGDGAVAATALGEFGLEPRKVTTPTAAEKVLAVAKRAATREVRHTMGPKQKARIKGVVGAPAQPKTEGSRGGVPPAGVRAASGTVPKEPSDSS